MKLWESIKDLSDFEVERKRRRDCTGKWESISVNNSGGISGNGWRGKRNDSNTDRKDGNKLAAMVNNIGKVLGDNQRIFFIQ